MFNKKEYPSDWFAKIRPDILKRANNLCEICKVKNGELILRGTWGDVVAFQDMDGNIFNAETGEKIGMEYVGTIKQKKYQEKGTRIVLTIAHLDQDKTNSDYGNLKALCQYHHLQIDRPHHIEKRKANKLKKQTELSL